MKKILSIVTGLTVFSLSLPTGHAEFDDIHNLTSFEAIQYLEEQGIVEGYGDQTFRPESPITRSEFLKIILESSDGFDKGCTSLSKDFSDVSRDYWDFPYICYAVDHGIVQGYPDGTFRPQNPIKFAEAAKIVALAKELDIPEQSGGEWFYGYRAALEQERVIPENIDYDAQHITRGDMAEIVWGIDTGHEVENIKRGDLPQLDSCLELSAQLRKFQKRNVNYGYGRGDGFFLGIEGTADFDAVPEANMEKSAAPEYDAGATDYSTTNVQEFGVDEADIVKNDGSHIFLIKGDTVRIIRAYPGTNLSQEAEISLGEDNFEPQEMYLDQNKLTIIGRSYNYDYWPKPIPLEDDIMDSHMIMPPYPRYDGAIRVYVYDISDRSHPEKLRSVTMEGSYLSSRKVGEFVYLVANRDNNYYGIEPVVRDEDLPFFSDSSFPEEKNVGGCADVRYFPNFEDPGYMIVAAINTEDNSEPVNRQILLGSGQEIYASPDNLYVSRPVWDEVYFEHGVDSGWSRGEFTEIFKFELDDQNIDFIAKARVEGLVLNQFSMSEYDDHFRIATQKGQAWGDDLSSTLVTILDKDLHQTGQIRDIAPGENMKSARFEGRRGYLVTFKTIDPLFVLDLTPSNPQILGKLKIPGWSDYLQPYGENYLIGFGREVDESIDADKVHSDNAIYYTAVLGMKISIFDISDLSNPQEIHKEVIGYRGTESEVLSNHKALLFDADKGIIGFPITVTVNKNDKSGYEADIETIFAGAYVYDISPENGFTFRGSTSHYDDDSYYLKSGEYFYGDPDLNIQRLIYIGDNFYSISPNMIKSLSWNNLSELNSLTIDDKSCATITAPWECDSTVGCKSVWKNAGDCYQDGSGTTCVDDFIFDRCESR